MPVTKFVILAKHQVHSKPRRSQTGQRTITGVVWILPILPSSSSLSFFSEFLSYHFTTLETIMSDSDTGSIDEIVATTTQSNRRGSTEKFNDDPSTVTSTPIPTPLVPPPRSTFKSIVLVLTVTFAMIINVGSGLTLSFFYKSIIICRLRIIQHLQ